MFDFVPMKSVCTCIYCIPCYVCVHARMLVAAVTVAVPRLTWSHQHSPKLGSCVSRVYSANSNPALMMLSNQTSRMMRACSPREGTGGEEGYGLEVHWRVVEGLNYTHAHLHMHTHTHTHAHTQTHAQTHAHTHTPSHTTPTGGSVRTHPSCQWCCWISHSRAREWTACSPRSRSSLEASGPAQGHKYATSAWQCQHPADEGDRNAYVHDVHT